jgi:hypothetical protein
VCGACGEQGAGDWARPFLAGLPARTAAATAVRRLTARPGLRVTARAGGWLVAAPTGATRACTSLADLVAAAQPWLDAPGLDATGEFRPAEPSGPLAVPDADARRGVRLHLDPGAARSALGTDDVLVPDEDAAREVLGTLARPPWSLRCYLAGVSGVKAAWGRAPAVVRAGTPGIGADLLVRLERSRQSGALDDAALAVQCPLDDRMALDVEVRAGHVVRARVVPRSAQTLSR